jgi:hypothetical protein
MDEATMPLRMEIPAKTANPDGFWMDGLATNHPPMVPPSHNKKGNGLRMAIMRTNVLVEGLQEWLSRKWVG